jgi:uncharacterized OB-fold protein
LIPSVIEIDGASKGMGILHMLSEIDPEDIKVGLKVKAVWKKPEERTGSITDILYFKPLRTPAKRAKATKKRAKATRKRK